MRKNDRQRDKKQEEKQLSFELKVLSSGKPENLSLKKHLSIKKEKKLKQKAQKEQPVIKLLSKKEKEIKLKALSLEGVKTEENPLKQTPPVVPSPKKEQFFENLVSVETVAEGLRIAPKTIHNWVYLRKIPYVKCGQKVMFRQKSLKAWLNRKEIKSWL